MNRVESMGKVRIDLSKAIKCPYCHKIRIVINDPKFDGVFETGDAECLNCKMHWRHERNLNG